MKHLQNFRRITALTMRLSRQSPKLGFRRSNGTTLTQEPAMTTVTRTTAQGGEGKSRKSHDAAKLENSNEQDGPANSQ